MEVAAGDLVTDFVRCGMLEAGFFTIFNVQLLGGLLVSAVDTEGIWTTGPTPSVNTFVKSQPMTPSTDSPQCRRREALRCGTVEARYSAVCFGVASNRAGENAVKSIAACPWEASCARKRPEAGL